MNFPNSWGSSVQRSSDGLLSEKGRPKPPPGKSTTASRACRLELSRCPPTDQETAPPLRSMGGRIRSRTVPRQVESVSARAYVLSLIWSAWQGIEATLLARFSILQPTGRVVGTFRGGKRPVHPSLPQAVLTEYLPVPALRLGSAPINPKDFKATLFWNLLGVATRRSLFKDRLLEASSIVTYCRYRHIGYLLHSGYSAPAAV
jgi:hypothetical protein